MTFKRSNTTAIPNEFFDMLPDMSNEEMRVVLAMLATDDYSLSELELQEITGLSPDLVTEGAEQAIRRGILRELKTPGPIPLYTLVYGSDGPND